MDLARSRTLLHASRGARQPSQTSSRVAGAASLWKGGGAGGRCVAMGQAESSSLCYNACTDAEVDSEGRRPRPRARGSSLPSGFSAQLAPGAHMRRKRDFPHSEAGAPPISNQLLTALAAREAGDTEHVPLAPDGKHAPPIVLSGSLAVHEQKVEHDEHEQKGNAGRDALLKVGALPAFQEDALNVSTMMGPMGFLLDQPEAYGPIYIAEVDEEGTARKLLKHPSIMLFEGDQMLEVDVRMRVLKRECSLRKVENYQ